MVRVKRTYQSVAKARALIKTAGFMRHVLYPQGDAVYATDANILKHAQARTAAPPSAK